MKNLILILIIAIIVSYVGAATDCNCFLRAANKCGTGADQKDCRDRFVARCSRRCRETCWNAVKNPEKCNCFLRAVDRCGSNEDSANCRNRFVTRCSQRCSESCLQINVSNRTILNQPRRCNCFLRAVRRCGASTSGAACRNTFVSRCAANCRESCRTGGRNSLRGCNCNAKATRKCSLFSSQSQPNCFNFYVSRCRDRCTRIRSAINSCECFVRSVRKCGYGADNTSRSCRNDYVTRCSRRCAASRFFSNCDTDITFTTGSSSRSVTLDFPLPPSEILPSIDDVINPPADTTTYRELLNNVTYFERDRNSRRIYDSGSVNLTEIYKSSQRICITESGCNCRTVATRKCVFSESQTQCYNTELSTCQDRCKKSRRCYSLSCQNAGQARCASVVAQSCATWFPEDQQRQSQCVASETQCCLRYEMGLCHRARRMFRFRVECDSVVQQMCGQYSGATKCQCTAQFRRACIADKYKAWKWSVRQYFDCYDASALICQDRRCGAEYDLCMQKENSICQPPCEREARISCNFQINGPCYDETLKQCRNRWRFNYCQGRANITCDSDSGCIQQVTDSCITTLPPCWKNESTCNDNNICTEDFCDPKLGCVNRGIICDDFNPCTTDRCDPILGCVYTPRVCNDNVICTKDYCDITSGLCTHVFDRNLDKRCWPSISCENITDCQQWGVALDLTKKCMAPICDTNLGACKAIPSNIQNCTGCTKQCFPVNQCDHAFCQYNEQVGDFVCVHRNKSCDDNNACTRDWCESNLGCRHTNICPNTTVCATDDDCVSYGVSQNVAGRCLSAFCNNATGVCDTRPSTNSCPTSICQQNCFTTNLCKTAKCVPVSNSFSYCAVQDIFCDDKKNCTQDSCDPSFGCQFRFLVSEFCPAPCSSNSQCASWGVSQNLTSKCQAPICDFVSGSCQTVTINDNCNCPDCTTNDLCTKAQCVLTSDGPSCQYSSVDCNDNIDCTFDYCDSATGQCLHNYTVSTQCQPNGFCQVDSDCSSIYFSQQLYKTCQDVSCNKTLGACQVVPRSTPCITQLQCLANCTTSNLCFTPFCTQDISGDYVCNFNQTYCNDNKSCTLDFCDAKSGSCAFPFRKNIREGCFQFCNTDDNCTSFAQQYNLAAQCQVARCNQTSGSCQAYPSNDSTCTRQQTCQSSCFPNNACDNAKCIQDPTTQQFTCTHTPIVCNDNKTCTVDTCNPRSGCVFTYTVSQDCPVGRQCNSSVDCVALSNSLVTQCQQAACNMTYGKCDVLPIADATCVTPPQCTKACPPPNLCQTVQCVKDAQTGVISCIPSDVNKCDDHKDCTIDSCDLGTGKCSNVLTVNGNCPHNSTLCDKNLDCRKWARDTKLDNCLEPVCNERLGICQGVPNGLRCGNCSNFCAVRSVCEDIQCFIDVNNNPVCEYSPKVCNDNNNCTIDTCQVGVGCVYTPDTTTPKCNTPICHDIVDCVQWGQDQNLGQCAEPYCNLNTNRCQSRLKNTEICNPLLPKCQQTCVAANACQTADCVVDPVTQQYSCVYNALTCDDHNDCTQDTCDVVRGCRHTYVVNTTVGCTQQCSDNIDCTKWGFDNNLSINCMVPACNQVNTSCYATPAPNSAQCPNLTTTCQLVCKNRTACETATCVRKNLYSKEFQCVYTPITCNDGINCTVDTCDSKAGCVFTRINSDKCVACSKDLDCQSWGTQQKLAQICQVAVCDTQQQTCVSVAGNGTCPTQCQASSDCPSSQFGTACCTVNGNRKCLVNECQRHSDCKPTKPNHWGYCIQRPGDCINKCIFKKKCSNNTECDDKNPCTKDVCVKKYGFCRWIPRCTDGSECTDDICIASPDGTSYQCRNPVRSCTTDPSLLNVDLNNLTPEQKAKWLGQCSHLTGCVSCVVNAQCDDHNGCTADSCQQQYCLNRPINNEWCDPKLEGQPITYQSIPSLRSPSAWFGQQPNGTP